MSTDSDIDPLENTLLAFIDGVDLLPGQFEQGTISVTLPGLSASIWASGSGTHHAGVFVDDTFAVAESDESNNAIADEVSVMLPALPELNAFAFNADVGGDDMLVPGETITLSYDYENIGTLGVLNADYDIGFYLSPNPNIDPAVDSFLGFIDGVDLIAGSDVEVGTFDVTLPSVPSPAWTNLGDTYYIGMFVDDLENEAEWNESNNRLVEPVTVTLGPACDLDGNSTCDLDDLDVLYDMIAAGTASNADIAPWLIDAGAVNGETYLPGDTNLDGNVGGGDFTTVAANFGAAGLPYAYWRNGNFDGLSLAGTFDVGGSDFTAVAANFGFVSPAPAAPFGLVAQNEDSLDSWFDTRRHHPMTDAIDAIFGQWDRDGFAI